MKIIPNARFSNECFLTDDKRRICYFVDERRIFSCTGSFSIDWEVRDKRARISVSVPFVVSPSGPESVTQ